MMSALCVFQVKRLFRTCVVAVVVASVLMTGCASQYGKQVTVVNYYPHCYGPIAQLREQEKTFVHNVAAGAIIGTVVGAAIGAAVGGARGAAIGAGAGLIAGGGIAAALTKYRQVQDDKERRSYLSKDMAVEAATLDRVGLSAALASKCYKQEFDKLLDEYKEGMVSREVFQAKATEIISGLNEIAQITKSFNKESEARIAQYQGMLQDEAKKDNSELPPIQERSIVAAPTPEPQAEPAPKAKTKKSSAKSSKSKSKSKQPTEETGAQDPSVLALVQQGGGTALAKSSTGGALSPSGLQPDVSTLPSVISGKDKQFDPQDIQAVADSSLKAGPDPASLPGVIAQRDNLKAKSAGLDAIQKETVNTAQTCISQAEAAGVAIPDTLKPKAG